MTFPDAALPESWHTPLEHFSIGKSVRVPRDLRQATRQEYPFLQRYAIYRENRWPTSAEFLPAEMCDISASGFALLLDHRPAADQLVVELGVGTNVSQALAQVVQITTTKIDGKPAFRIGCEFVVSERKS